MKRERGTSNPTTSAADSGRKRWPAAFVGIALIAAAACSAGTAKRLPPVTTEPTQELHAGKFVWFDLLTEEPEAARGFYEDVLGWTFEEVETSDDYWLARRAGVPVAGLQEIDDEDPESSASQWVSSLSVGDVDRAIRVVQSKGGRLLEGPVDVEGRGRMAIVRDSSGAVVALLRAQDGDPADEVGSPGDWIWSELWTHDVDGASAFYTALVGYRTRSVTTDDDRTYVVLDAGDQPRAGLVEIPFAHVEPNWLPYVRVGDVDAAADAAVEADGGIMWIDGDTGILLDPTGAAVGVQEQDEP